MSDKPCGRLKPKLPITEMTWLTHCKLTSVGGSECGECACTKPDHCQMKEHPDFQLQRKKSRQRMFEYLTRDIDKKHADAFKRLIKRLSTI